VENPLFAEGYRNRSCFSVVWCFWVSRNPLRRNGPQWPTPVTIRTQIRHNRFSIRGTFTDPGL